MRIGKQAERDDASVASLPGIRVVDLSEAALHGGNPTPLHEAILDALRRATAGVLSREELLAEAKNHSLAEIVRVLRDLSVQGLVKILWRSPFSFFAFVTERVKPRRPLTPTVRALPS